MSMLNPAYLQVNNAGGTTNDQNQTQQDAQMMYYQNYQNYQNQMYTNYDPSMYFDPSTLQTMAQSGMFNMEGMQMGGGMVSMPFAQPPLPPQSNMQIQGNTMQDFSQDVTVDEANSKKSKKKSQGDGTPAKKLKSDEKVTLFVGSLHPDANEEAIWNYFEEKDISLSGVRKKVGKMFCHVDLADPDDLHSALALNGQFFMGLPIRLEKATLTVNGLSTEGKDTKTLFVANLADTVTEKMLKDVFPDCLEVRYPVDRSGAHSGYAFLKYDDEVKVKALIEEFQGFQLEGNSMILDYAAAKNSNPRTGANFQKDETSLFIGNLKEDTSLDDIWEIFPNATEVRNPNDGRKSYCFVKFNTSDQAKVAMEENRDAVVNGRRLIIDFADKTRKDPEGFGAESGNTNILVVKNLSFKTNEDRLRQEFPEVTSIRMVYFAGTQRPKGFIPIGMSSVGQVWVLHFPPTLQRVHAHGQLIIIKRYAFLEFESSDAANDVYDEINEVGRTVNGRVLVAEFAVQKGSHAFKIRGKKIEEQRLNECKQKSMWGPHGIAYEGVEMPSNFAYGTFGTDASSEVLDNSMSRGYGAQEMDMGAENYCYDDQAQAEYSGKGKGRGGNHKRSNDYENYSEGFARGRGGKQSKSAYGDLFKSHRGGRGRGGSYGGGYDYENYSEGFVGGSGGKQFKGGYRGAGESHRGGGRGKSASYGGYNDLNYGYDGMMESHVGGGKARRSGYDNSPGYGGWKHGRALTGFGALDNNDGSQDDNHGFGKRGGKGNQFRDRDGHGGRKSKGKSDWSFTNVEEDGTELPFSFTGRSGRM